MKFSSLAWSICIVGLLSNPIAHASGDSGIVYYSADDFQVTDFDLKMYLRKAPPPPEGTVGSRARNLKALSDLYAMQILMEEADDGQLISDAERQWIAEYAVAIEVINRYLSASVAKQLDQTDWESEALEDYLANPQRYEIPENVTVRALLIRTDRRTEDEALAIVSSLRAQAIQYDADFAELVREHTEDETAAPSAGLLEQITRGQTVAPFERAAFALREPNEFSEPVISEVGVHLIQLLEYQPARKKSFEESKEQIIADLRPARAAKYRQNIQDQARERKASGFVEHTEALDSLIRQTSDGPLGQN